MAENRRDVLNLVMEPRHEKLIIAMHIAAIIILPSIFYYPALDNFFAWDDFLWLQRGRDLFDEPLAMFRLENNSYFDPLVYVTFWANYNLFGTVHQYYNVIDLAMHIANALLLYVTVLKFSKEKLLSFLTAAIFATTFSTVTAVVWTSARTDLLCTFFVLLSTLFYAKFCETGKRSLVFFSALFFVFALSSKGTAVVFPLMLLGIVSVSGFRQNLKNMLPFFLLSTAYFIILFYVKAIGSSQNIQQTVADKLYNLILCVSALFMPQDILLSNKVLIYVIPFITLATAFLVRRNAATLGFSLMVVALTPVLYLNSQLHLVDLGVYVYELLSTPSHRIYLASTGASLFLASLILKISRRTVSEKNKIIFITFVFSSILIFNYTNIQKMEKMWNFATTWEKMFIGNLKTAMPAINKGETVILFSNQPLSTAFKLPMLKIYYNREALNLVTLPKMPDDLPDDPSAIIMSLPEKAHAFAYTDTADIFYDVSKLYSDVVMIAYRYKVTDSESERLRHRRDYRLSAFRLNSIISNI